MGKVVTLGELMIRFATKAGERFKQSKHVSHYIGGGEANVAISLANYGHQVSFASKVPENILGDMAVQHLQTYGVQTNYIKFGGPRLGTYYVEAGVGQRPSNVIYDRAQSSFSIMEALEWDVTELFKLVDVFHISGITPALSERWQELTLELIQVAKTMGCRVSFDINYRSKLWTHEEARDSLKRLLPYIDYCSASVLDAIHFMGVVQIKKNHEISYYYEQMQERYPNIEVFYSTKRDVVSATANRLQGAIWMNGKYYESRPYDINPIVDRIGGGDAYTGGILHGLMSLSDPQQIVDFATAAAVLKHTVEGDSNIFNEAEVLAYLSANTKDIAR